MKRKQMQFIRCFFSQQKNAIKKRVRDLKPNRHLFLNEHFNIVSKYSGQYIFTYLFFWFKIVQCLSLYSIFLSLEEYQLILIDIGEFHHTWRKNVTYRL